MHKCIHWPINFTVPLEQFPYLLLFLLLSLFFFFKFSSIITACIWMGGGLPAGSISNLPVAISHRKWFYCLQLPAFANSSSTRVGSLGTSSIQDARWLAWSWAGNHSHCGKVLLCSSPWPLALTIFLFPLQCSLSHVGEGMLKTCCLGLNTP